MNRLERFNTDIRKRKGLEKIELKQQLSAINPKEDYLAPGNIFIQENKSDESKMDYIKGKL